MRGVPGAGRAILTLPSVRGPCLCRATVRHIATQLVLQELTHVFQRLESVAEADEQQSMAGTRPPACRAGATAIPGPSRGPGPGSPSDAVVRPRPGSDREPAVHGERAGSD